ncbi:hypothetical protein F511_19170 [Dorcoceras hygrometricum]|uniref:Uncharacterized protein n=1 Tax=Dorcoceras hygrometricum TaxID=472368 RepID=A0A2Z7DD74_9LAMI|nr:hypothetical protein F511_19170 [Dorcoceras hygrometricum]
MSRTSAVHKNDEDHFLAYLNWNLYNSVLLKTPLFTKVNWVFIESLPCWHLGAWLRPVSRGNRNFKRFVAVDRQSETPRRGDQNESDHVEGGTRRRQGATQGGGRRREVEGEEGRPNSWSRVRTNQYNQDLGLIHSTNGNHLESPNEGSSIDHQVTIHLHAQNITMFHTNETWYFASQMLVSSLGGLILILTAQSTRNEFRIHSDYDVFHDSHHIHYHI